MEAKVRVAFIGFMGSGKSSTAQELGKLWQSPPAELDLVLLERNSEFSSIKEIFDARGERFFRTLESEALEQLSCDIRILSPGGGILGEAKNRDLLRDTGFTVVYLHCPFEVIAARLEGDTTRPLFQNISKAKALYETREPLYERAADVIIDSSALSSRSIALLVDTLVTM